MRARLETRRDQPRTTSRSTACGERRIVGLEALARWTDGDRGPVPPDEFIPVAERTGVIHALGAFVMETLCAQAQAWDALGLHPNFGINVSPRQLLRPGFAADVRAASPTPTASARAASSSSSPSRPGRSRRPGRSPALEELAAAGFVLALDDFGAGYSSLSRLRRLPVEVIKVDRAFMEDLPADPQAGRPRRDPALANAANCDVVTEGVETPEQLASARTAVPHRAGLGLGRPQTAAAVTALLRELADAPQLGLKPLQTC